MKDKTKVFDVGGLNIRVASMEYDDDDVIDFTVTGDSASTWRFAIMWGSGEPWKTGRIAIDPISENVPIVAVEWAINYSRDNR